jgi:iduronate 2-sulfatase
MRYVIRCRAALLVALALLAAPRAALAAKPNVLFITIDDLRCETGCYGVPAVRTPNLDRLAARGMRFDRAYVQVTFCNPSRASFLTGLRPDVTGVLDNKTKLRDRMPDVVTLPQFFRENGYHTMRVGKIFHGGASMDDPKAWDMAKYPAPTLVGRKGERRNMTGGKIKWCWWMAAEGGDEDQPDGQIAAEGIAFLRDRPQKPFFLALGFYKPHDPFVAPKKYFDMYPLDTLELYRDPPDCTPLLPMSIAGGWKKEFARFTDRERREFLRSYYAGTTFVDTQIGKVLGELEKQGLADDTIIFLMSDHGYHLGERGWWNKSTLFERSARSPMILCTPAMKGKGKACSRLVEFLDVFPTLTEICGLANPPGLAGRSMVPLLDDPEREWKEAAYTQIQRGKVMGWSVRSERWRYIEWDGGRQGGELYDHDADPEEYKNVAKDPRHAGVVKRHKALLKQIAM